jgi:hypothetical protein
MAKQSPSPQHHSPAALRNFPCEIQLSCAKQLPATVKPMNKVAQKPKQRMGHPLMPPAEPFINNEARGTFSDGGETSHAEFTSGANPVAVGR